jgi:hypothetical protein
MTLLCVVSLEIGSNVIEFGSAVAFERSGVWFLCASSSSFKPVSLR